MKKETINLCPPHLRNFYPGKIPGELKKLPQWVNWIYEQDKDGKETKIPLNPKTLNNASSTDPKTWADFEKACNAINLLRTEGIGFVVTDGDPYTGVDLDKCRNPETQAIDEWAKKIIEAVPTYWEVSPSGTGLRGWLKGKLPKGRRKKGPIEVYNSGRYLTVTGNTLNGSGIAEVDGVKLHRLLFGEEKTTESNREKESSDRSKKDTDGALLEKMFAAKNGAAVKRLWEGDISAYPSQSEADLSLCSTLWFWTGDREEVDRLFRLSGLFRQKWDKRHHGDGRTYGQGTLDEACNGETYKADSKQASQDASEAKNEGEARGKVGGETESTLRVVSITELMTHSFRVREDILAPWLHTQGLAMVHAWRGIGKTHFVLGIGYAVSSAGTFLRWQAPTPRGVLYLDGEMPGVVLQERIARLISSVEFEPKAPFNVLTPDIQDGGMPDLSTAEGQDAIEGHLGGIELVIVDNLTTLCRTGRENEGESWLPVQGWALNLRRRGISVLFVHHDGKGGLQRGSARKEDVLDTVIHLRKPVDYRPDEGARFEVHFEKNRGVYGDAVKPFEAALITNGDAQEWLIKEIENSTAEKVAKYLNEGVPQSEIHEMLGITRGAVSKAKKRATEQGWVK